MKKRMTAAIAAMMALLLCACAPRNPAPSVETTSFEEAIATRNSPTRKAFREALKTIHDDLTWPFFPDAMKIEIVEPATIDDQQFAIFDVDGDGEEELLVSITDTYTAGMHEVVFGYDAEKDELTMEAEGFPGITYYSGMMKILSSHNQGHAGDVLWPYGVLTYDPASDSYESSCFVDAWDRNLSETDFEGNPYPTDIDVDNVGHVYLISDSEGDHTLNQADFEKWEADLFSGKEEITVPWQYMTLGNIS